MSRETEYIECPVCSKELTIKNAVNPSCGHSHCSECFWKWTKTNNTCPICRSKVFERDRTDEILIHNLISRSDEMRQALEDLYAEEEFQKGLIRTLRKESAGLKNNCKNLKYQLFELQEQDRSNGEKKLKFQSWEITPKLGIKYWTAKQEQFNKLCDKNTKCFIKNTHMMRLKECFAEFEMKLTQGKLNKKNRKLWKKMRIQCQKQLIRGSREIQYNYHTINRSRCAQRRVGFSRNRRHSTPFHNNTSFVQNITQAPPSLWPGHGMVITSRRSAGNWLHPSNSRNWSRWAEYG